jgi:hypothetical protein
MGHTLAECSEKECGDRAGVNAICQCCLTLTCTAMVEIRCSFCECLAACEDHLR